MNSIKKAFLFFVFLTASFFGLNANAQKSEKKEGKEVPRNASRQHAPAP